MKSDSGVIASDSVIRVEQRRALQRLAGTMIPADAEFFGVPGADDDGIFAGILVLAEKSPELVDSGLRALDDLSLARHGAVFVDLADADAEAVAQAFASTSMPFVRAVVAMTVQCYYRDPRVMTALGMEPRAPYPVGFTIEQGDWSLLDPVRRRSKLWRDAG